MMSNAGQSELNGSMLFSAFTSGLRDSINPYNLAMVLIFIILLSLFANSAKRVFWFGGVFIAASALMHFSSLMGYWDALLTSESILSRIRIIYLVLAIFFVLAGIYDFLDWSRYKRNSDVSVFRMPLPAFFHKGVNSKSRSLISEILSIADIIIITWVIAGIATLMGTIHPQDEHIFIVHSYMMSGGDMVFVGRYFALYSLAMVLLLIIAWIKIWWLTFKKRESVRALVFYKIVLSAIFLSTGLSLGYLYVK